MIVKNELPLAQVVVDGKLGRVPRKPRWRIVLSALFRDRYIQFPLPMLAVPAWIAIEHQVQHRPMHSAEMWACLAELVLGLLLCIPLVVRVRRALREPS